MALEDEETKDKASTILKHIELRLTPDDESLLETLVTHDPDNYDDYRARLWAIVVRSLQKDPPFWRVEYADVPDSCVLRRSGDRGVRGDSPRPRRPAKHEPWRARVRRREADGHGAARGRPPLFALAHERDADRVESDLHDEAWYARRIAQARWSAGYQREAVSEFEAPSARGGGEAWRAALVERLLATSCVETKSDSDDCSHGCSARQSTFRTTRRRRSTGCLTSATRRLCAGASPSASSNRRRSFSSSTGRCSCRRPFTPSSRTSSRSFGTTFAVARASRRADLDRSGRLAREPEGRRLPPVRSRSLRRRRPGAGRSICCVHDQIDVDATASRAPRQAHPSGFRR